MLLSPFRARPVRAAAKRGAARIPVTIVTGFLGAGKTTLVRAFPGDAGRRAAPPSSSTSSAPSASTTRCARSSADEIALLGNGCLCCNTRSDLQIALRTLVADRDARRGARISGAS